MKAARDAIALSGCRPMRCEDDVVADLIVFQQLLEKWQRVQNLVSRETLAAFWSRHIADSLQLVAHLPSSDARIVDLGSGGGLPALPMAIALKGSGSELVLIESNHRKVAFLRAVARELDLPVTVIAKRITDVVSRETGAPDVFTARALAPLTVLCQYCWPLWNEGARTLFHKGREYLSELEETSAEWAFDVVDYPSVVDRSGAVLELTHLRPKTG